MTRSVEILVAAHVAAHARRRRGQDPWAHRIPVAGFLEGLVGRREPEAIASRCLGLAALLRAHLPSDWLDPASRDYDRDLDEMVDRLEGVTAEALAQDPAREPVEFLDAALEELYDWADLNRVSCGLPGAREPRDPSSP